MQSKFHYNWKNIFHKRKAAQGKKGFHFPFPPLVTLPPHQKRKNPFSVVSAAAAAVVSLRKWKKVNFN